MTTERDELVACLREQVADLRERLRTESERRANETERFANVTERSHQILANLLGSGLARADSFSSSLSLPENTKPRQTGEFQDLHGETRARGRLANGVPVPGSLGDEPFANDANENRTVSERRRSEPPVIFDSQKAETELRRKPLQDPEMVAKARAETERLEREFMNGDVE